MSEQWWYALVSASPNPEAEESVNVGLVVGNGQVERMEFDEGLRRLGCLVGSFERDLFRHALESVRTRLSSFSGLPEIRQVIGPQLRISAPRPLYTRPDEATLKALLREFVSAPSEPVRRRQQQAAAKELDETIIKALARKAFGVELKKRATPADLYPRAYQRIFDQQVPTIDRVLRRGHKDLLIGGVRVGPRNPSATIRSSAVRLGRAFWHYGTAKDRIREEASVEIRTVGLIFNGVSQQESARDALEYIAHIWQLDADHVISMHGAADLNDFRRDIDWLTD